MHNFIVLRISEPKKCSAIIEEAKRWKAIISKLSDPEEDTDTILDKLCDDNTEVIVNLMQFIYAFSKPFDVLHKEYRALSETEGKIFYIVPLGNDPYSLEFDDKLARISDNILEKIAGCTNQKHYGSFTNPTQNFYLKDLDRAPIRYENGVFGTFYSRMLALFAKVL
jgi:hypothetical protein